MKNIFKILIISLVLLSPFVVLAAIENIDNAGFVPGPIWFSKYPVFVDDEVRIYTALYNNSQYNISGELHFYNNVNLIGSTDFEMLAGSGAMDVWIDWVAEKGDIEIGVEIKNVSIMNSNEEAISDIDFKDTQIASSKIFVDFDNDKDGVGNIDDDDDDNDGVSDLEEIAEGTNPFVVDHVISTSSLEKETDINSVEEEKKSVFDKFDDSVMGFLNKVSKNKVDQFVDTFSGTQVEKLEIKKDELEKKINYTLYDSLDNIVQLKTTNSTSTADTLNTPDLAITSEYLPKDLDRTKVKSKINIFFKNSFSKIYLLIVNILIFFLNHAFFLFLLIFFIIYLAIRKIIRFFVA